MNDIINALNNNIPDVTQKQRLLAYINNLKQKMQLFNFQSDEINFNNFELNENYTLGLFIIFSNDKFFKYGDPIIYNLCDNINFQHIKYLCETSPEYIHKFCDQMMKNGLPNKAVKALKSLCQIFRIGYNQDYICLVDTYYLMLCWEHFFINDAINLLNQPIYGILSYGTSQLSLLGYFYYGACIYIEAQQFKSALEFLQLLLSLPTKTPSCIQLAGFQRYILISLIVNGKYIPIPDKIACNAIPMLLERSKMYLEIANEMDCDIKKFEKKVYAHKQDLKKHKNIGLAKQVLQAQIYWKIRKLTNTYSRLSFKDISSSVGIELDQVENILVNMYNLDMISVKIDSIQQVASFNDTNTYEHSETLLNVLHKKMQQTIKLNQEIEKVDRELSLSDTYLTEIQRVGTNPPSSTTTNTQ